MRKTLKRKILATTMAAAMMVTSGIGTAMAADESDATIYFEPYYDDIIIIDPTDPPYDAIFPEMSTFDLDFHTHYTPAATTTFESWVDTDPTQQDSLGVAMAITDDFTLSVRLGEFTNDGDVVNNGANMDLFLGGAGLTAQLDDDGDAIGTVVNDYTWQAWDSSLPGRNVNVTNTTNLTAGMASGVPIVTGTNFPSGTPHYWAAEFVGELTIHAGTAVDGLAQAEKIWVIS